MSTLSYGSKQLFWNGQTFNWDGVHSRSVAKISSTSIIQVYADGDDSTKGKVVIGSISGGTITYGSPLTFCTSATSQYSIDVLDSTHFVVFYKGTTNKPCMIIGVYSGTTISSFGTEVFLNNDTSTTCWTVRALDATHYVVAWSQTGGGNDTEVMCCSVSGTTITLGSGVQIYNNANPGMVDLVTIDATHFAGTYMLNSAVLRGFAASVSGTTITLGTQVSVDSSGNNITTAQTIALVDSTHVLITWSDNVAGMGSVLCSVSGISLSAGTKYWNASYTGINTATSSVFDLSNFMVIVEDPNNSNKGTAYAGAITAGVITFGVGSVFNTATTDAGLMQNSLSATTTVIAFRDNGVSNKGTHIIATLTQTVSTNASFLLNFV